MIVALMARSYNGSIQWLTAGDVGSIPTRAVMTWLTQLLDRLFCWIPRPWFVNPDESGVRITLGKRVKDCPPGWYIEVPLIHQFIKVNVATQGVRFAIQSAITADDVDVAIRGAVLYRISDARKAIFETDDFDESLEAVAGGVIASFVAGKTYEQLRDRDALKAEIRQGLREEARGWGIKLMKVYLPDIGRVKNIRVLGHDGLVPTDINE